MTTANAGPLRRLRPPRAKRSQGLNLVALMDIFTILVFFLLVNSVDVQDIPARNHVELPESAAERTPRTSVTLTVTNEAVLLDEQPIIAVADLLNDPDAGMRTLSQTLAGLDALAEPGAEVTVLGDRGLPFRLLKQVMSASTEAGFERVSLAVIQKAQGGPAS